MFSRNHSSSFTISSARLYSAILFLGLIASLSSVGCGKQETAGNASAQPGGLAMPTSSAADAEAVVSSFLDRIRRGGQDHDAMSLLTDRAQSELKRVGQVVQPIGSPDAKFRVTRSTPMPVEQGSEPINGRLVHCVWSEPSAQSESAPAAQATNAQGGPQATAAPRQEYQVVWSVIMQKDEYKISGLILEMDPNQPPLILDFENGDLMAQILGGQPEAQTAKNPAANESAPIR